MLDLFVEAPWRSRGIGRALVVAVACETVRRGYACLEWRARANNHRAKKFYRRLGARVGHARVASLIGRALTALAAPR
jgi:ribosomal protein S18 acetylase RimI-like enzyme